MRLAMRYAVVLAVGCGDGVPDPGEVCDDGNRLGGDGCAATCRKVEQCGDGILEPGAEQCDEGTSNSDTRANQCRTDCTLCATGLGLTIAQSMLRGLRGEPGAAARAGEGRRLRRGGACSMRLMS
jgi:cysteine-rich repeat protein